MKLRVLAVLIVAGAAAGCGYFKKDPDQAQLASGCQIIQCVCQKVHDTFMPQFTKAEPKDVLWRKDGGAYCPEGYDLQPKQAPSIYDRPLY